MRCNTTTDCDSEKRVHLNVVGSLVTKLTGVWCGQSPILDGCGFMSVMATPTKAK